MPTDAADDRRPGRITSAAPVLFAVRRAESAISQSAQGLESAVKSNLDSFDCSS